MVTLEKLNEWLASPKETERLEFKKATNQFDNTKLINYCAALANEGGGYLILGVTDTPPRRVAGTNAFRNLDQTKFDIYQALRLKPDIFELRDPAGRVLVFDVPPRPQGVPVGHNGYYPMRVGESLVGMTVDQLSRIMSEGKAHFLKQKASTGLTLADVISRLDVQTFFELLKLPYPEDNKQVADRLAREGMVIIEQGSYAITNLGALLLARNLRDFDSLHRRAPRLLVYKGSNKLETIRDIPGQKGYAVAFQALIATIMGQLPANEVINNALRTVVVMYPEIAIRELVANAIIHQDFDETGSSIMIEIYSDRMEISNPGKPLVSTDRFVDEYKTRNEMLADFMRRVDICEERSSGIDKVVSSTEAYQLPAPDFRVGEHHTTTILFAHKEFEHMNMEDRVRACYLHCCLRYVSNSRLTNQSLRERFQLPESKSETVSRIIAEAIRQGKIKPENPDGRSKRYMKYLPYWA
ncbi:MAG: putative DNA binding domain-containing protein [Rhodospirillales bacterium]|nr:putative DNA binding domain-containing protein [Rhodospirillales bacterium]